MSGRGPGAVRARLLALGLAVACWACGQSGTPAGGGERFAGTTITFSIAVPPEEKPAIQELLSRFQDQTKAKVNVDLDLLSRFRRQGVSKVNLVTSIRSEELIRRLEDDARKGRPTIHLFAQDNLALKPLVDADLVEDLSEVEVPGAVIETMLPPRFDGRQLFLPFRPNVRLAYADEERFREAGIEPPRTLEELVTAAERLKARAGEPKITLSLAEGSPAAVTVSEWIVSFGGDPLVLNDQGSVRAFELLQRLWAGGLLARESLFAKYDTEVEHLRTGVAWFAQNWSFTSAQLAERGLLGRFRVYGGLQGPARTAHVIGGDVLGIPKGVTGVEREAALALARFLMSRTSQELLVRRNAWPSIRDDAYRGVREEERETFTAIREALDDGWFRPSVSYWSDVSDQMNEAVTRILLEHRPVRPVLDELHAGIEEAARRKGAPYPPRAGA